MMLEIKQFGTFCFLVVEIFVKMPPLSEKEQTKNYRKNMSNDKLRKVCENDKLRKRKERQQEKFVTLRELNKKKEKRQGSTVTLQTKVKINQGARIGRVPCKGKKDTRTS